MIYSLLLFFISALHTHTSQPVNIEWTLAELQTANTGRNASYLSEVEKETLLYLNLARLYPRKYALIEVPNDILHARGERVKWHSYRHSLLKELNKIEPMIALMPDSMMTANARCFARELGETGKIGHQRERCPKENIAECNAFGIENGRNIVMHLLIDYDVPNVGHRRHMLDSTFALAGLGNDKHVKYRHFLVLVMK